MPNHNEPTPDNAPRITIEPFTGNIATFISLTPEEIREIYTRRQAPLEQVSTGAGTGIITSIKDISSIWKRETKLKWLIPDLIPEGMVTLISGESSAGKSFFSYFLAGR